MVYGLRYYYRLQGINDRAIALPSLKGETKLPVILNREELKQLFAAPILLKQRIVLSLIYSAGLRGQEVINLKIGDVDFERKTIHIRQSKYKKDTTMIYLHVAQFEKVAAHSPFDTLYGWREKQKA
jgi:integrase